MLAYFQISAIKVSLIDQIICFDCSFGAERQQQPAWMRPYLKKRAALTWAGVCIQMAALNRMWSHSCFSSGAPCVRPSRYLAKDRKCSSTALVMWTRDDWWTRTQGYHSINLSDYPSVDP